MIKHLITVALLLSCLAVANANGNQSDWKKVWDFKLEGFDFDPAKWSGTFKDRFMKAGLISAAVFVFSKNITYALLGLGFSVGVVQLDYQFVLAAGLALYGYFRKQTVPLIIGSYCSYWLLWGKQPY